MEYIQPVFSLAFLRRFEVGHSGDPALKQSIDNISPHHAGGFNQFNG